MRQALNLPHSRRPSSFAPFSFSRNGIRLPALNDHRLYDIDSFNPTSASYSSRSQAYTIPSLAPTQALPIWSHLLVVHAHSDREIHLQYAELGRSGFHYCCECLLTAGSSNDRFSALPLSIHDPHCCLSLPSWTCFRDHTTSILLLCWRVSFYPCGISIAQRH